jgi:methionine synthase II (cobalamin-independent)
MKNLNELFLRTTDTGSLPLEDDFIGEKRNVDRAIVDKIAAGLDYPCYPQLAGTPSAPMNMGLQFLTPLSAMNPGIQIDGQNVRLLSDEIMVPNSATGVERPEYFQSFLREHKLTEGLHGVKACVTGPFTLASYLDSRDIMTCGASKPDVVAALAQILAKSCRRLSELEFDLISIDEPFLALMLGGKHRILFKYDENFIIETLNTLIGEISCFAAIHVCGTVTPAEKEILLACKASILDHEFAGSPGNLKAYTREELQDSAKFLAYGCVSSINPRIESVEEISTSVRNALDLFGPRIIVKPDCGFAGMQTKAESYQIALQKLKNMSESARRVRAASYEQTR